MNWGEVNPTHAYYYGSRTSKDNEDPGWNTNFKTRRTQKTTSAVEALWKTILRCYLYLLGTLSFVVVLSVHADVDDGLSSRGDVLFILLNGVYVARTPQQNEVSERRNKTLIEAARTMLADSKTPILNFLRPSGCLVTIINTIDHLGKFDGKADEGFFVGYSLNSKAFRVRWTPDWLFDIDALTRTMNYEPIVTGTQSNGFVDLKSSYDDGSEPLSDDGKKVDEDPKKDSECKDQKKEDNVNSTNNVNTASNVNTVSSTVNAAGTNKVNAVGGKTSIELLFDPNMSALEDDIIFDFSRDDEDDGTMDDMNNLDTTIQVSPNPTTRIHKDHPLDQVIRDLQSAIHTRKMLKNLEEHGKNPKRNKKDEKGIVIRNKARLVDQGYTQEEGIDYDEVFAPVARIEAIRLFLAYASFKDFVVYQMDVKSVFLYEKIEEEVYVCQPPGFEDPDFPDRVYKVEKALYRLHQALRAWYETLSTYLLDNGFQRGKIDKTLFIKRHKGDILLVQVYVDDIIFGLTKKELCNAFEKLMHEKFFLMNVWVLQKSRCARHNEDSKAFVRMKMVKRSGYSYDRLMISSLSIYSFRPDICLFLGFGIPMILYGLVAYTDSDYAGASLDRKSTTGEAEYMAALSFCGQVLDGENLDKMKEKGDPCVMVGYSTQSKGYRVYNKRTRLIVESIHIKFDEIKEMMSDHNSSDLAPQRQEMSVENVSSGLVPQGQKASDYDNSDPVPPRQNVVPSAEKSDSSQQGLEFLFSPFLEEYYNPTHGQAEENNNDQAPNASFQEAEFINPFCTRIQEIGESSSRNIDNTDVHSFKPQSNDFDGPEIIIRTSSWESTMQFKQDGSFATDP
ncbi:retrovirus-related pol polyprotein from transposon TNT 1-94 [Tanacetum coccineum]